MKLKQPGEICKGKNRYHGAQVSQVIEGPLTPVIPHDGSFLLACIFARGVEPPVQTWG